jgi:hypothetical protein
MSRILYLHTSKSPKPFTSPDEHPIRLEYVKERGPPAKREVCLVVLLHAFALRSLLLLTAPQLAAFAQTHVLTIHLTRVEGNFSHLPTPESNPIFHLAFSRVDHINVINMPLVNDAQSNIKSWRTRLGFGPINVCGTSSWPARLQFETLGLLTNALVETPGETEEEPTRSFKVRFSSCTMTIVPSWSIGLRQPRSYHCLPHAAS